MPWLEQLRPLRRNYRAPLTFESPSGCRLPAQNDPGTTPLPGSVACMASKPRVESSSELVVTVVETASAF